MGFHLCSACKDKDRNKLRYPNTSSGDVNLSFTNGRRYVMPDMILHYVADHGWQPPAAFVEDVMTGEIEAHRRMQTRGVAHVFENATRIGYLEGEIVADSIPDGFIDRLDQLMKDADARGARAQTKDLVMRR
jgi:hypothetical protein